MRLTRPDLAALIVLGVVVVGIAACAIARVDVPSILSELGILLAGIAGGAAIPSAGPPSVAAELAPAPLPPAPAPLPPVFPPARSFTDTGVIPRVANHL